MGNEYILKGGNSVKFFFVSLVSMVYSEKKNLLLKSNFLPFTGDLCLPRHKDFRPKQILSFYINPFPEGSWNTWKWTRSQKSCLPWQNGWNSIKCIHSPLTHCSLVDFSPLIYWKSPFATEGVLGVIF